MEQYIDKSAVVAEIERYKHKADERLKMKDRTLSDDMKDLALQNLCGNLLHFINTLEVKEVQEEPVSNDLEEAAWLYYDKNRRPISPEWDLHKEFIDFFKAGAQWQKENLWKPADGEDLPEIDSEVIALVEENEHYKVVFAHRPPEYWDGKNILTGKVTHYEPKRYDKGGWNMSNIKYWLDLKLPKMA